jgi:hypothetical protein
MLTPSRLLLQWTEGNDTELAVDPTTSMDDLVERYTYKIVSMVNRITDGVKDLTEGRRIAGRS